MTGSLVVAIIVVVGFALSITFALKATESSDPAGATDPSSNTYSSTLSSVEAQSARLGMIAGCENAGGPSSKCTCIADQTIAAGYDTAAELSALQQQIGLAARTGDVSGLPAPLAAAYQDCVS
jgi:hypothetical protein